MGASVIRFPVERTCADQPRQCSDVWPVLSRVWRSRDTLDTPDWAFVVGLAIDRKATCRDRWRLGRIADRLQGVRR